MTWATSVGGWLGVGNDSTYNNRDCFNKFPFAAATEAQQQRIRELGEALDAHRKKQQAAHPGLTITGLYNVLEKLRSGEALSDKEKKIHDDGLVSVLKKIRDDLDAAVYDGHGWPATLSDDEILEWLVALNHERAAEEKQSFGSVGIVMCQGTGKRPWTRAIAPIPPLSPTSDNVSYVRFGLVVCALFSALNAIPPSCPDAPSAEWRP